MKMLLLILTTTLYFANYALAEEDGHDHSNEKHSEHKEEDGHNHKKHKKHKGHKDGDEHNHEKNEDPSDHDDHKKGDDHSSHGGHGGHEGHDEGGGKAIGKNKAITEVSEEKGFKLSKEAIKTMKLALQNVSGDTFEITKKTLVVSKATKGVFRFRGGYFKLLTAQILKETSKGYQVKVQGVDFGDQIVTNGVQLLRVTDIYSKDKSEYGHAH